MMMKKTFIDLCLSGEARAEQIDDYVEYWHTHDTGNTLKEFLGMTDLEYAEWATSSDEYLKNLIEKKRKG